MAYVNMTTEWAPQEPNDRPNGPMATMLVLYRESVTISPLDFPISVRSDSQARPQPRYN